MDFLKNHPQLWVRQKKEWTEILVNWETKNQYAILDAQQNQVGFLAEKAGGFTDILKRGFFRSHRSFQIGIFDQTGRLDMKLSRPFFFFFSDLTITDANGQTLGHVERRFGILHRKYHLKDHNGHLFATISSPLWKLWTFPVRDTQEINKATISKKWAGALREIFSDADTFMIDFSQGQWTLPQKAMIFAAAISIDFDFFENNQGASGALDLTI